MNITKNKSAALVLVIFVGMVAFIRTAFYLRMLISRLGILGVSEYISIALNFYTYTALFTFAVNYFLKGKDVSLTALVFKFGLSSLATLMELHSGSKVAFMLTAVMVFLVPYVSASMTNKAPSKSNIVLTHILIVIVLAISTILAALYIKNPIQSEVQSMGLLMYRFDAMNPAIEWTLFTILTLARSFKEDKRRK